MEHLFPSDRQRIPYLPADPLSQEDKTGTISIYHPGYPEGDVPFLELYGHDSPNGDISWDLAHTACAIIANNAFGGFLSKSRKVDAEPLKQKLLPPGKYYFHVQHSADIQGAAVAYKWPVVSNFRSWEFPHGNLPGLWCSRDGEISNDNPPRRCAVTNQALALDSAHIVPSSESRWFLQNDMIAYSQARVSASQSYLNASIDGPKNELWLRSDVHRLLDGRIMTFVPKKLASDEYQTVIHCFTADYETRAWYHNRPLYYNCVPREYLLARLAWSLFGLAVLKRFLLSSTVRLLRHRTSEGTIVEQDFSFDQRLDITLEKSKSTSPKKRKPGVQEESTQESNRSKTWDSFDSGFDSDSDTSQEPEAPAPAKRRRRSSSSSNRRKRRRSNDDDDDEDNKDDGDEDGDKDEDDGNASKLKRPLRRRSDFDFDLDAYGLGYLVEEPRGRKRSRYIWE